MTPLSLVKKIYLNIRSGKTDFVRLRFTFVSNQLFRLTRRKTINEALLNEAQGRLTRK